MQKTRAIYGLRNSFGIAQTAVLADPWSGHRLIGHSGHVVRELEIGRASNCLGSVAKTVFIMRLGCPGFQAKRTKKLAGGHLAAMRAMLAGRD